MAGGTNKNEFKIFEKASPKHDYIIAWSITNINKGINCLDMSPNCEYIAFGSADKNCYVLNSKNLS